MLIIILILRYFDKIKKVIFKINFSDYIFKAVLL